ncbi:MAG: GAF domain-containing protein [Actinobacteria bacterium]|nr:MAG: GAF domain-containing protein [Actinomycetota bacterium]REK38998.1 MAG: GAF domain-containing protein [Actinomycetota bacterium]
MFRQASSREWRIVIASALEQMDIASWELNLDTGELWWSENAGPLFGRPRGFVPAGFAEADKMFASEDQRPRDLDLVIEKVSEGPVEVERRALLPDGSIRWTYHRYFLMNDGDGRPQRLAGMMTDIDERKRREIEDDLLIEASHVLGRSLELEKTLDATAQLLVPSVADWCVIHLSDEGSLEGVAIAHVDPEKVRWARKMQEEYPPEMDAPYGPAHVIRTGEPELYSEIPDEVLVASARGDERRLELLRSVGYRSALVVPLRSGDSVIGAMTLVTSESNRRFDQNSLEFAERLGGQMAVFIDNARLHTKLLDAWKGQSEAIETLQKGLTPDPLPELASVAFAAHYEIGGEEKVGGDWYNAFLLPSGLVAMVIGDVVGRGVPAVTTMTEYRNALRVLLVEGYGPGEAISRLNSYATWRSPDGAGFATASCLLYDPDKSLLTWASAGHPPTMLRSATGVERLDHRSDPPIGVKSDHSFAEFSRQLSGGQTLVLYTDGLIEHRKENIDVSIDRLATELAKAPSAPEGAVKHLLSRLPSYPSKDDVAILVAQFE